MTLLYFIGQAVAQAAWTTPYSLIDNRVSDLGNTACGRTLANTYICSPLQAVMNTTFVLTGVLILVGLFLTRSIWPQRRLTTWALILLGVAGLGTILVGLSPENANVLIVSTIMLLIAVIASYVPAQRAMSVDPVEALRAD